MDDAWLASIDIAPNKAWRVDDQVVGAIGVSGSLVPHDVQAAAADANVFNTKLR